jgi:murein DD-endopeptidase MepM/ murein hydrolase activator NlpD
MAGEMIVDPLPRGFFPEIRFSLRTATRSAELHLPPAVQAAALAAALGACCALAYLAVDRIGHDRLVAEREMAVVRAERANVDLQDDLAGLRDKLAETTRDLGQAQQRQAALSAESGLLRGELQTTDTRLNVLDEAHSRLSQQKGEVQQLMTSSHDQRELYQLQAQRATLAARLSKVESDYLEEQDRVAQYKTDLDGLAKKLQQLSADRDNAAKERDRMRARVGELEQKLSMREAPERVAEAKPAASPPPANAPPAAASAPAAAAPESPPRAAVGGAAGIGHRGLDQVERVLAAAGVDVERLFSQFGVNRATGGPFVALAKAGPADELSGIRGLIQSLPLSAPLADYQIESGFGPRHDPFNERNAFHTGIDLSAPYMSPVYATAPGIVTYAGYRPDYGKVVEIDHGHGISTVYAHLHRYTVADGEQVSAHTQIGFLGSTGRSSGPHVHYEVKVHGEPQDPEKFLELAHLIPVAQR